MPRKRLEITATQEQLDQLMKALKAGSPLQIALQYANISATTYYYWIAMYSVVVDVKSQEELENLKAAEFGVSIDQIKEIAAENTTKKKASLGAYIEPTAESIMQYKNSGMFRKFANKCYEIIKQCNSIRAEAALGHLASIAKSVNDKRINASGSMWYLERMCPDYFAKANEKAKEEEGKTQVEPVKVEYIKADNDETKERIKNMEELILKEQKGVGQS